VNKLSVLISGNPSPFKLTLLPPKVDPDNGLKDYISSGIVVLVTDSSMLMYPIPYICMIG